MKPIAVLLAGSVSLLALIVKLVFDLPVDWVWIAAPLWVPMAVAYLSFGFIIVQQLALGNLVVKPGEPATAEQKSDVAAEAMKQKNATSAKIDLNKPKGKK